MPMLIELHTSTKEVKSAQVSLARDAMRPLNLLYQKPNRPFLSSNCIQFCPSPLVAYNELVGLLIKSPTQTWETKSHSTAGNDEDDNSKHLG